MNIIFKTLLLCLLLGICDGLGVAQGYRGLVPLRSGCEDVKRILGVKNCDIPVSKYVFDNETVKITFSKERCVKAWGNAWNVPGGTVIAIHRIFRIPISQSASQIDLSKFNEVARAKDIDEAHYLNQDDGMLLLIVEKQISEIEYFPTSADEHLVCPTVPDSAAILSNLLARSSWFDRYNNLPFTKEKRRLDNLAKELKQRPQPSQVYIVVYRDRRNSKSKVMARAKRARNYLTRNYGIDANRIKIISGGTSKSYATAIYIVPFD